MVSSQKALHYTRTREMIPREQAFLNPRKIFKCQVFCPAKWYERVTMPHTQGHTPAGHGWTERDTPTQAAGHKPLKLYKTEKKTCQKSIC